MNINARSLLFGAQHAARLMALRGGGAIVALSSLGSIRVIPDYVSVVHPSSYRGTCALFRRRIGSARHRRQRCVTGIVATDALTKFAAFRDAAGQVDVLDEMARRTPAGRLVTPAEVADVVMFCVRHRRA